MTAAESLIEMAKDFKRLFYDSWAFRKSFVEYRLIALAVVIVGVAIVAGYLHFMG